MNILLGILLAVLTVLISFLVYRWIRLAWYKLHDMAGIEVGMSQYSVPPPASLAKPKTMRLAYQSNLPIPNTFGSDSRFELMPDASKNARDKKWFKAKNQQPRLSSPSILGIDGASIERMPTAAVMLLDTIHDKLIRYQAWQRDQSQSVNQPDHPQTPWLTENKFVVNRLIEQTIPEAVHQYDQIAKYHPSQLNQKIQGEMTAGEILIEVLARVNLQLDELLNEMFHEVSQQFSSTYRYVKNRT